MILQPSPKRAGRSHTRTAAETLRAVRPWAERAGVTRIADITGLDRVGIPTFSAIIPRSRDFLSVYLGKSARRVEAMAGAVMEALERQTALNAELPLRLASFSELGSSALDPRDMVLALDPHWTPHAAIAWVEAFDISHGAPLFVPAQLAGYLWNQLPGARCFTKVTTNGLAAGNTREEAVSQALCELIERDAWTIAQLVAHWVPRASRERFMTPHEAALGEDDAEAVPCIDPATLTGDAAGMHARFSAAGLRVLVRDLTTNLGVPVVLASTAEDLFPDFPQAHFGVGCHPEPAVAARRAIAELAQSRCGDIQAVREDLIASGDDSGPHSLHTRRVKRIHRGSWYHKPSLVARRLSDLPCHPFSDLRDEIHFLLARLRVDGLHRVLIVDFTPPGAPFAVVRAIVPGLESWGADHGRIGERATRAWRAACEVHA